MIDLTSATAKLTRGKTDPTPVLVSFARQGEQMLTVVDVGVSDLDDPGAEPVKAWIPVATQVLTTDLAEQLKIKAQGGLRVTQVYNGKTSGTLGLNVGDVILKLDGDPIPASQEHDVEVFPTLIRQYPIGTEVTLTVLRDGKSLDLKGGLTGRPPQPREMPRYQDHEFDFTVRDVAYLDRMHARWEDNPTGLLVESVEDGGWAALGRMGPGDLLMEVDGKAVGSVMEIKKIMERIKTEKKTAVIFKVRRGVHNEFLEIEPLWKQEGQ
jgi:serine protease Do